MLYTDCLCMYQKDSKVDDYILSSADFAKPILEYLRMLVVKACPEVQESIKWSFPNFTYKGSILCSKAAFKTSLLVRFLVWVSHE